MEKRGGRGLGFEPRGFIIVVDDCHCVIWSRRVVGTFSAYQVTINEKKIAPSIPLNLSTPHRNLQTLSPLISISFELFLFILVSITCFVLFFQIARFFGFIFINCLRTGIHSMIMSPIVISFQRRKKIVKSIPKQKKAVEKTEGGEEDEAKRNFWIWTGHFLTVRSRWSLE